MLVFAGAPQQLCPAGLIGLRRHGGVADSQRLLRLAACYDRCNRGPAAAVLFVLPLPPPPLLPRCDRCGTRCPWHQSRISRAGGQTPHCLRLRRSFSEIPSPQSLLDGSSGLLRCGPRRSAVLAPVLREPYCRQATFSQSAHSCVGPLASRAGAAAAAAAAALAALREVTSSSRSPAASPSSPSAQRASRRATTMRLGDRLRGWGGFRRR